MEQNYTSYARAAGVGESNLSNLCWAAIFGCLTYLALCGYNSKPKDEINTKPHSGIEKVISPDEHIKK
ncbi:MAG: hypothetical protein Q8N99_01505 [Nanoarchaeota archaeon]|nr:hypothetical protein [Nanoarchaeota archaeon]